MDEGGGGAGTRLSRESTSYVSGGAARAHQQREYTVHQGCRTEFQYGDFEGPECS